jgi:hypothetical protein
MPTAHTQPPAISVSGSKRLTRRHLPHLIVAINCLLIWAFYHDWTHANPAFDSAKFLFGNRDRELTFSVALVYLAMDISIFLQWVGEKKASQYRNHLFWIGLGTMGSAFLAFQLDFWLRLV